MGSSRILPLLVLAACTSGQVRITGDPVDDPSATPEPPTPPPPSCDVFEDGAEGVFLPRDTEVDATLPACTAVPHAFASARGATVQIAWFGPDVALDIVDFNGTVLQSDVLTQGQVTDYTPTWSGEHLLRLTPLDAEAAFAPQDYRIRVACIDQCALEYTRYPLFYMHGMAGTDSFLDSLDYWYGVADHLEPRGFRVHTPAVDPFQPSEVRAAQWAAHLDDIVASGTARRFNLIGHSQGGIDARFVTSILDVEQRVASVTTISTPHHGTAVADVAAGAANLPIAGDLVDGIFDAFTVIYDTNDDQDIVAQLDQLTTATMEEFNATVPDRVDVHYASWAGQTCQLLDLICQATNGGEIVTPLFSATHLVMEIAEGNNDGLVGVESAQWGQFLGTLPADHLDEVGLFPGTTAPGFDHLQFFEEDAQRLADLGF
jgi:triacylglycerol lipase